MTAGRQNWVGAADLRGLLRDWLSDKKSATDMSAWIEMLILADMSARLFLSADMSGRHVGVCERRRRKACIYSHRFVGPTCRSDMSGRQIGVSERAFTWVVQQQGGHIEHITLWISSSECWNCSNGVGLNIWCFFSLSLFISPINMVAKQTEQKKLFTRQ